MRSSEIIKSSRVKTGTHSSPFTLSIPDIRTRPSPAIGSTIPNMIKKHLDKALHTIPQTLFDDDKKKVNNSTTQSENEIHEKSQEEVDRISAGILNSFDAQVKEEVNSFVRRLIPNIRGELLQSVHRRTKQIVSRYRHGEDYEALLDEKKSLQQKISSYDEKVKKLESELTVERRKYERRSKMVDEMRNTLHQEVISLKKELHTIQFGSDEDKEMGGAIEDFESFSLFDWMKFVDEETTDEMRRELLERLKTVAFANHKMFLDRIHGRVSLMATQLNFSERKLGTLVKMTNRIVELKEKERPSDGHMSGLPVENTNSEQYKASAGKVARLQGMLKSMKMGHEDMTKKLNIMKRRIAFYERERVKYTMDKRNVAEEEKNAPDGLTYMVFTDVQGSTATWEMFPEYMQEAIHVHLNVLRENLVKYRGYEVKTEGDGYFCVFKSAVDAANFTMSIQFDLMKARYPPLIHNAPNAVTVENDAGRVMFKGLRVRAGIHEGKPQRVKDEATGRFDYYGRSVNRAARVASCGSGGQTIISYEVSKAISDELSRIVGMPEMVNVGVQPFKGLDISVECYELLPRELLDRRSHFQPLNTGRGPVGSDISEEMAAMIAIITDSSGELTRIASLRLLDTMEEGEPHVNSVPSSAETSPPTEHGKGGAKHEEDVIDYVEELAKTRTKVDHYRNSESKLKIELRTTAKMLQEIENSTSFSTDAKSRLVRIRRNIDRLHNRMKGYEDLDRDHGGAVLLRSMTRSSNMRRLLRGHDNESGLSKKHLKSSVSSKFKRPEKATSPDAMRPLGSRLTRRRPSSSDGSHEMSVAHGLDVSSHHRRSHSSNHMDDIL